MIRKVLSNSYQRWTLYNLPHMYEYIYCIACHIFNIQSDGARLLLIYINAPYFISSLALRLSCTLWICIWSRFICMNGSPKDSRLAKYCIHSRKSNPLYDKIYTCVYFRFLHTYTPYTYLHVTVRCLNKIAVVYSGIISIMLYKNIISIHIFLFLRESIFRFRIF